MTVEDARKILDGGDTAATEYFKAKTSGKLYGAFQPIVSSSMNDVGTTRSYKEMMGRYTALPFASDESLTWTGTSPTNPWTGSSTWWGRRRPRSGKIPPPG